MSEHKDALNLATAALYDIIASGKGLQAATIRNASREDIEAMRSAAHDKLDAYLDHMTSAATHVRAILD